MEYSMQYIDNRNGTVFDRCIENSVTSLLSLILDIDPEAKLLDQSGRYLTVLSLVSDKIRTTKTDDGEWVILPAVLFDGNGVPEEAKSMRVKEFLVQQNLPTPFDSQNQLARSRAKALLLTQNQLRFLNPLQ